MISIPIQELQTGDIYLGLRVESIDPIDGKYFVQFQDRSIKIFGSHASLLISRPVAYQMLKRLEIIDVHSN